MRKVTIVVPVLMTNCQVSLKSNSGPVNAQLVTTPTAIQKAPAVPNIREQAFATLLKIPVCLGKFIVSTLADLPKTPTRCLPQKARSSATDAWTLVQFIRTRDFWDSLWPGGMNHPLYLVGCLVLFQTICPHGFPVSLSIRFPLNTANLDMLHERRRFSAPGLSCNIRRRSTCTTHLGLYLA